MSNAFVYSVFLLWIVAIFSPLAKLKVEGWDAIAIDVFIASFPFHLKGDLKEKAWPHLVRLPKTFASWQLRNLTWPHLAVGFRPPIALVGTGSTSIYGRLPGIIWKHCKTLKLTWCQDLHFLSVMKVMVLIFICGIFTESSAWLVMGSLIKVPHRGVGHGLNHGIGHGVSQL